MKLNDIYFSTSEAFFKSALGLVVGITLFFNLVNI